MPTIESVEQIQAVPRLVEHTEKADYVLNLETRKWVDIRVKSKI